MLSLQKPIKFTYHAPPVVYHCDENNSEYLIFVPNRSDSASCIKYDIKTDKQNIFAKYSDEMKFDSRFYHNTAINNITNELYVYLKDKIYFLKLDKSNNNHWISIKPKCNTSFSSEINVESMVFSYDINNKAMLHILSRTQKYYQYAINENP